MIVGMKKMYVICPAHEADHTLDRLHTLGVLHLEPVEPPEGRELDEASRRAERVRTVLRTIEPDPKLAPSGKSGPAVVEAVWALYRERRRLDEEIGALSEERERVEPFGSFDPERVKALAERGIHAGLYTAEAGSPPELPAEAVRVDLHRDRQTLYFGVLGRGPMDIDAEPVRMPEQSLEAITSELERKKRQRRETQRELRAYGGDHELVARMAAKCEDALNLIRARLGMGHRGPLAYITGYCPEDRVRDLYETAGLQGWGVMDEEPGPADSVPTLIRYPGWVKPIKVVFDFINIVPGYRETDIGMPFLVFFGLFFAMIVGDAGYGLLFLAGTLLARVKWPEAPKTLFQLLFVMSVATIAWGVVTGTWFGLLRLPAPLRAPVIPWLKEETNLMLLCFLIGAVHLTLAHAWRAFQYVNRPRALAELGWIGATWVMFFTARSMVLGFEFPGWCLSLLGAAVLLIVVFMTPVRALRTEWFNHVMLPLDLIGNFVDVVSYVRLFAVGMATFAMASAFNAMGMGMAEGGGVGGMVGAVLIIFLGHTLNIALAAMGVLVHGIRLNTLEFSGHLGLEWKGIPYRPFTRTLQQKETT